MAATSSSSSKQSDLPTDAQAVRNILKTMGVEQHEPRVINMLLDFMYSYVSGVLSDASAFAEQVGRQPGEVENEDVVLAVQTRAKHSFVPHPPVEVLRQLADQVNEKPLPILDATAGLGLRVPKDEDMLIQPNWSIKIQSQQGQDD
eukprot:GHUV01006476.1.p1 GENE.GHUV01006476.1~~GHUV01006476.1.p1  ORF type:complete len:146 (+),score=40.20 GHUV01006476.1:476-913(+)